MNQPLRIPMSIENRRRAVYTALIQHLSADELWESLSHWEDAYAENPAFSSQKFLSDILVTPELRSRRSQILQSLVKSLAAPPATLLPDPREQLLVYRMHRGKAVTSAANSRDPAVAGCASLLSRILRGLDDGTRLRMRLYVLERLERTRLSPDARRAVQAWLNEQTRLTLASADPAELRQLISVAYMGLCEYIGPIAADAALARALKQIGEEEPGLLAQTRALL